MQIKVLKGHNASVYKLLVIGIFLVSIGEDNVMMVSTSKRNMKRNEGSKKKKGERNTNRQTIIIIRTYYILFKLYQNK